MTGNVDAGYAKGMTLGMLQSILIMLLTFLVVALALLLVFAVAKPVYAFFLPAGLLLRSERPKTNRK